LGVKGQIVRRSPEAPLRCGVAQRLDLIERGEPGLRRFVSKAAEDCRSTGRFRAVRRMGGFYGIRLLRGQNSREPIEGGILPAGRPVF
jgi:hypothetical protein